MKTTAIIAALLLTVMFSSPLRFLKPSKVQPQQIEPTAAQTPVFAETKPSNLQFYDSFKVLLDGQIHTLSADEYTMGVLAAEMPLSYSEEALKAQAVAAYTFACHRRLQNSSAEYDITADSETDQAFIPIENAKSKWGDNTDRYLDKLQKVIDDTKGLMLTYNNAPALSVYHAISPGVTVDCEDVWGDKIPYLVSVDSAGDMLCEDFISSACFSPQELLSALGTSGDTSLADQWFQSIDTASSGKVRSVKFCDKSFSGGDVAKALGLRSSNFTVNFDGQAFTFTVKGYGHGVGMSQTGAEYMAQQGADFKEILAHYYPACTLETKK